MRKFGLIVAIVGLATLGSSLLLPGIVLLTGGSAILLSCRFAGSAAASRAVKIPPPVGTETARLLDNFEQRFAELKGRKPNATVLNDLYTLGSQLEQRGRAQQATAVYRHLARMDNTYRDVAARLRRLLDAAKPKAAPPAPADAGTAAVAAPAGAPAAVGLAGAGTSSAAATAAAATVPD